MTVLEAIEVVGGGGVDLAQVQAEIRHGPLVNALPLVRGAAVVAAFRCRPERPAQRTQPPNARRRSRDILQGLLAEHLECAPGNGVKVALVKRQRGHRLGSANLPSDFLEIDIVSHRFPEPALVGVGVKPRRDERRAVRAGRTSRQRGGRQ